MKITRQPAGSIDGIQLDDFIVGFTYEVGTLLGCYLLAERLAEPAAEDGGALGTPATSIRTRVRFDLLNGSAAPKVTPFARRLFSGPTMPVSKAAERSARRRQKRDRDRRSRS